MQWTSKWYNPSHVYLALGGHLGFVGHLEFENGGLSVKLGLYMNMACSTSNWSIFQLDYWTVNNISLDSKICQPFWILSAVLHFKWRWSTMVHIHRIWQVAYQMKGISLQINIGSIKNVLYIISMSFISLIYHGLHSMHIGWCQSRKNKVVAKV